ncbi:MAG: hypothetical protein GXY13_08550 [Acidimicrobiales bacterium]|nr:hypothetical protein [Acidimicrobiales bacterium]
MSNDAGPPPDPARRAAAQRAARPLRAEAAPAGAGAPVPPPAAAPVGRGRRGARRGRRVKRVVRRVELWSVLKVSLIFNVIMALISMGVVALLWALGNTTGLVEDLEGFLRSSGFDDFRFRGDRMFTQVAVIASILALAGTVMSVLMAALFNLISEMTGGVQFVVIEEVAPAVAPAPAVRPVPVSVPTAPPPARPAPVAASTAPAPVPPA